MKRLWLMFLLLFELSLVGKAQNVTANVSDTIFFSCVGVDPTLSSTSVKRAPINYHVTAVFANDMLTINNLPASGILTFYEVNSGIVVFSSYLDEGISSFFMPALDGGMYGIRLETLHARFQGYLNL